MLKPFQPNKISKLNNIAQNDKANDTTVANENDQNKDEITSDDQNNEPNDDTTNEDNQNKNEMVINLITFFLK